MTRATTAGDARYPAYLLLSAIILALVAAYSGGGVFDLFEPAPGSTAQVMSAPGGAATNFPGLPVDLNTATKADLKALPGIGERTATVILAMRAERGGLRSIAELGDIKWMGPVKLQRLEGLVTVVPVREK